MTARKCRLEISIGPILCALLGSLLIVPNYAFAQSSFFRGKTITIINGNRPGGTADMRMRSFIPYLEKYIPGNPRIVAQYMPGGGGLKLANHLYRAVRPDGLTIGNPPGGFVLNAILGGPGVKYRFEKFTYLGSGNSRTSYVFVTKKEAELNTIEKLQAASRLRIGTQSVGHTIYIVSRVFAYLLGLQDPKFVTGYSGTEIDLALLRGEVDARANIPDTVVTRSPQWIEKGLVDFHVILEIPKGFRMRHPAFEPQPALESFTNTDKERQILEMFRAFRLIGSPYIIPPGMPKQRVETLQGAFRNVLRDPQFTKTFRKLTGADAYPLTGDEQERTIRNIPRDPEIIALFKKITSAGPLPPR